MNTISEIVPFFLMVANITWHVLWEKSLHQKKWILLPWIFITLAWVLVQAPLFENDFFRYFVDGLHFLKKINPYQVAPGESPFLKGFPEVFSNVGFSEIRTIYPPLAIYFFSVLVFFSGQNLLKFKVLLKFSALTAGLVGAWFSTPRYINEGTNRYRSWLFIACHPFLIFEWAINLHFDFWVALSLLFFVQQKKIPGGFWLGLASGFKYFFGVLSLFPRLELSIWRRSAQALVALATLWVTFTLFPYELTPLMTNIEFFAQNWEMNSGAFRLFRHLGYVLADDIQDGLLWAYALQALSTVAVFVALYRHKTFSFAEKIFLFLFLFILLSPVCNPWYFSWMFFLYFKIQKKLRFLFATALSVLPLSYVFFLDSFQNDEAFLMVFNGLHFIIWVQLIACVFRTIPETFEN